MTTDDPIRVMVVDDTVTYRKVMSEAAGSISGMELGERASSGMLALKKLEISRRQDFPEVQLISFLIHVFKDLYFVQEGGLIEEKVSVRECGEE